MNMHRNLLTVFGGLALLLIWSSVMLPTTSASATRPEPEKGPSSTLNPLSDEPITVDGMTLVRLHNASAANGQYAPLQDNGNWRGTTSQNLPISFTVASNMVTFLHFGVHTGTFLPCDHFVTDRRTHNITGNTFSVTGQAVDPFGGTLTYTVTGTFNSNTSASGNLQATVANVIACQGGSVSPTWTATWREPEPLCPPPTNLTALAWSETEILLDWQDNCDNDTGVKIEQALAATGPWTQVATTPGVWYMVSGLNCGTTYYYRVRAYNASGDSAPSNIANATTSACSIIAPSNLTALALSPTQISLQWQDNSPNETGFKIEQALTAAGPWSQIATTPANVTSHAPPGLNCGTTYYYQVRAYNASGDSAPSNTANATTLPCPINLTALALSPTQILLTWQDNSTNETGFKIEQSLTGTGGWIQIATTPANVNSHTVSSLNCSTTYYYRVRAYNASGDSAYSNTANAPTLACTLVYLPYVTKSLSTPTGRLAFASDRDGNDEIYVMNADGTGQTPLTNNPAEDYSPAWGP